MLNRLLPSSLDNHYSGHKAALWLFGIVTALRTVISVNSMLMTQVVATGPDGIPLQTFSPAAADTVLSLFALLGLASFTISIVLIAALIRYRSAIPALFLLIVLQQLAGKVVRHLLPLTHNDTAAAGVITTTILVLTIAGFVLSLLPVRARAPLPAPAA